MSEEQLRLLSLHQMKASSSPECSVPFLASWSQLPALLLLGHAHLSPRKNIYPWPSRGIHKRASSSQDQGFSTVKSCSSGKTQSAAGTQRTVGITSTCHKCIWELQPNLWKAQEATLSYQQTLSGHHDCKLFLLQLDHSCLPIPFLPSRDFFSSLKQESWGRGPKNSHHVLTFWSIVHCLVSTKTVLFW